MASELREQMQRAGKAVGMAALGALAAVYQAAEQYQNMPHQCAGCRRTFQRKEMRWLRDGPEWANRWWLSFCEECAVRIRSEYQYQGILADENRKVLAQVKRAIDRNLPGTLTLAQWIATLNHFGWRCAYCKVGDYEALEHCVPIELGGGTSADNCVPACKRCNSEKGSRHPDDIRESSRSPAAIARVRAYLATQSPGTH